MALFDNLPTSLGNPSFPPTPVPAPRPPAGGLDLAALIAAFQQGNIQQTQIQGQNQAQQADARIRQQREALAPRHLGMSGGVIDPTSGREAGNPFDTGFFKSAGQRQQIEQERLGTPGFSSMTPGASADLGAATVVANPALQPGSAFSFLPPDNTYDQIITEPPIPGQQPLPRAAGALARNDRATAALRRQRGSAFAF